MHPYFGRTERLIGEENVAHLGQCRVAVFGIGGVGGYVVEALARAGLGALDLFDKDDVDPTNLNRQIIATINTIGRLKVEVAKERVLSINPECNVTCHNVFYLPEVAEQYDFSKYDYVVDAVDTVTAKLTIIEQANKAGVPVISCMGTGNKLDPSKFQITDIYKTSVCPLAKVMRRELKKRGIRKCKVLFSMEEPKKPIEAAFDEPNEVSEKLEEQGSRRKKATPASISFVPSVAGLMIAGEVVKSLIAQS